MYTITTLLYRVSQKTRKTIEIALSRTTAERKVPKMRKVLTRVHILNIDFLRN